MTTLHYPLPENELERLTELRAIDLIRGREPQFDAVVALARDTFKMPMAYVSLLDEHEQWFKAWVGYDACSMDRKDAFCNYTVASGQAFVVEDAAQDSRFKNNPLVTGPPKLRFYAGVPFGVTPGVFLGALCISDTKPRTLTEDDRLLLQHMAEIVTSLIKHHRDARGIATLAAELQRRESTIQLQAGALARSKVLFNKASKLTKSGAWEWDLSTDELVWTEGMYALHEMPIDVPVTWQQARMFYGEQARLELERLYAKSTRECRGFTFEEEIITAKGNRRWVLLSVEVDCEGDKVVRRYGVKKDITEQKALWDRLRYLAERDPLTGLCNRSVLQEKVSGTHGVHNGVKLALLLIDMDGFKFINDNLGHVVGDECLKQVASRLTRICRSAEIIARLGGDEFGVLIKLDSRTSVEAVALRVLSGLRRPVRWRGQTFQLSASVGIATAEISESRGDLFKEADLALHAAKAAGRNTFCTFTSDLKKGADARFEIIANIATALKKRQLELFYQPKVTLLDDNLSGFEALLRWRKPGGEIVAPGAFEAALADPELSVEIGEWVVGEVLDQAEAWSRAGLNFGHIAINLNSSQLHNTTFATGLIDEIKRRGLRPEMIEVEVTEGVFLRQESGVAARILQTLRDAGLRIALDDFGTGYASLVHLRTYPVDVIKIDRSFTQRFLTSVHDHAIVQSTLFLARHLGMHVVAEGIELADQSEFLSALGCKYGQGFLFSEPLNAKDAREWCLPIQQHQRVGAQ